MTPGLQLLADVDAGGNLRLIDGNLDFDVEVDMGALEFQPGEESP